jgi:hypothetical protein
MKRVTKRYNDPGDPGKPGFDIPCRPAMGRFPWPWLACGNGVNSPSTPPELIAPVPRSPPQCPKRDNGGYAHPDLGLYSFIHSELPGGCVIPSKLAYALLYHAVWRMFKSLHYISSDASVAPAGPLLQVQHVQDFKFEVRICFSDASVATKVPHGRPWALWFPFHWQCCYFRSKMCRS